MKHFADIVNTHLAADRAFAADLALSGQLPALAGPNSRQINDQAYFLLLFAQLDDLVTGRVKAQIEAGRRVPEWRERRLWDALDAKRAVKDIPFKVRLALVIDQQRSEYRDAIALFDIRNSIAHGSALDSAVSINTAINQLQAIASLIQEVP